MAAAPKAFAGMIEHMASLLAYAQRARGSHAVDLRAFDCAQPYTSHYLRVAEDLGTEESLGMIFSDVAPSDLERQPSYCVLADATDDDTGRVSAYIATAVRPAGWKNLRGMRLPFLSPCHARLYLGLLNYKGTYEAAERLVSYHPRERVWYTWSATQAPYYDHALDTRVRITLGAQFSSRYEWHVNLGIGIGPRVSLPCTPEQARKLFAARDLPFGENRRAALLHWVNAHFREREGGEPRPVRGHFRGASHFSWERMTCEILAPAFDREQAAATP